jgi:DNA-binding CsgD family transcriptional regulator
VVGQGAHLEHLARRLDATRTGHGGAILASGLPGAGASTLCRDAAAASGLRTVIIDGTAAGALAGAGLHDLHAALGTETPRAGPPLAVAIACHAQLVAAGEREPTVVVVDDADRLDAMSASALAFAAPRLSGSRVLMLVAARAGRTAAWETSGITRLHVAGLDEAEAASLLAPAHPRVARAVWEATGGNAQAVCDAAGALTPAQRDGTDELPELGLPAALLDLWRERLTAVPAEAAVLAAAAAGAPAAVAVRALRELGVEAEELDRLASSGLVRLVDGAPRPPDGLAQSALLQAAPPSAHAAARSALAAAWTDAGAPAEAARQLIAAPLLADARAAGELAAAGRAARAHGAHTTAAAALRAAAARTLDAAARARLLLEAADAASHDGPATYVVALAGQVADEAPEATIRFAAELSRAQALLWQGTPAGPLSRLRAAAAALDRADLLASAAVVTGTLNEVAPARALAERALAVAGDDAARALAARTLAWVGVLGGDPTPLPHDDLDLPRMHAVYASSCEVAMWLEQDGAAEALRRAARAAAPADRPHLDGCAAEAALRGGDWRTARELADEAAGVGAARACLVLARLDAMRGDDAGARRHAESVLRRAGGLDRLRALAALGALELACGTPEAAARLLGDAHAAAVAGGVREPGVLRLASDLVDAQVRCGRHDEARRVLATLEHAVERPWVAATTWRCRGLLAPAGDVDAAFSAAERHVERIGCPFEYGRLALARGERLRRDGRRVEARRHLRAAVERFATLEAWPWRERAARELRVSGTPPPRARAAPRDPLTPQEVEVAELVAGGRTNREVAAAVFISTKTIEFHLCHLYRKLGMRSRNQLAMLRSDPMHRIAGAGD